MNDGGVRGERVRTEGVADGEEEEGKGEVGFVADLENDLGDLGRCKAGGRSGKRA